MVEFSRFSNFSRKGIAADVLTYSRSIYDPANSAKTAKVDVPWRLDAMRTGLSCPI